MRRVTLAVLLVLGFCLGSSANAATLNVVGGQLVGASNVLVAGNFYDVEFLDGTCIALFSGCDSVTDFTFQTAATANAASQALLDQVFLDSGLGNFDSNPELTSGCSSLTECTAFTPAGFNFAGLVDVSSANNNSGATPDSVAFVTSLGISDNITAYPSNTYARWTLVPEPGTGALMTLGLMGLAAQRRRSN